MTSNELKNFSFKCPLCLEPLLFQTNLYACSKKHSFDISKDGYVNLLLVNQKKSKNPGDNTQMIQSRHAFLTKGYYKVLADALIQIINTTSQNSTQTILDLGCGEGYYLKELSQSFEGVLCGIDISKSAVQLAAKRKIGAHLAVANAYNLPFLDNTFTTIYSIFSPFSVSELLRTLQESGTIIIVGPGEEHLQGLTQHIYKDVIAHNGNYNALDENSHIRIENVIEIKEHISIPHDDILDFLRMTPYYWQVNEETKERILMLETLETLIHFYIKTYRLS